MRRPLTGIVVSLEPGGQGSMVWIALFHATASPACSDTVSRRISVWQAARAPAARRIAAARRIGVIAELLAQVEEVAGRRQRRRPGDPRLGDRHLLLAVEEEVEVVGRRGV